MCFTQDGYATVSARTSESAIFSDPRRFFFFFIPMKNAVRIAIGMLLDMPINTHG